jgi:iron complex transport system substrate-binding protein
MRLKLLIFLILLFAGTANAAQRIISLAPSLTKIIYSLGKEKDLVGCTSYCEADKKLNTTVVASMVQVNCEKILLLKPDLVLATGITKPSDIETLQKLGLKVMVFQNPKSFKEICNQFCEIGALIGKKAQADHIVQNEQAKVIQLQKSAAGKPKYKIFFQIGAKPLFTVIPNTFMNDYITYAGGLNIAAKLKQGTITRENVILQNPDVIIIVTMGIVGPEEKKIWESYSNLSAVRKKKIFIIDSNKACVATPQNFTETLGEIVRMING